MHATPILAHKAKGVHACPLCLNRHDVSCGRFQEFKDIPIQTTARVPLAVGTDEQQDRGKFVRARHKCAPQELATLDEELVVDQIPNLAYRQQYALARKENLYTVITTFTHWLCVLLQ